ncbi:MAG: fatty acid desaturase [Planctomycetota bacterium]|nr:MAG: fatty acid desaturase [Planctomycetota bacterium]
MNYTAATDRTSVSQIVDFWPRFLLFPILAVALYPPFVMGWGGDHWLVRTAWVGFLTFCWFCVGGAFHESVHHTLFKQVSRNVAFGRLLGVLVGIPYSVYRETHRRHHACLNTHGDYELWPYSDLSTSLVFRRVFIWVDLLGGVVTAPYLYGRVYFCRDPRMSPDVRRTIFWEYVATVLAWFAFAFALMAWTNRIGFDWRWFDPIWVLPLILSPMVNTGRKFVEHLGMESVDPILGTRTVVASNPLTRITSYFNFDIAVHGPHHRYPKSSHNELASRMRAYQHDHPGLAIPLFGSYMAAIVDMVPCMWNRPSTGHAAPSEVLIAESPEHVDWD